LTLQMLFASSCQTGPFCDRYSRKDQLRAVPAVPAYSRLETVPECSKKIGFAYQPFNDNARLVNDAISALGR
jgi:hypothetical protein